ncbi:amino acid racemase [Phenylobacterium sp.]|uniref:aspartate/glutamate racemase family protein n=1 Tax=Phenylobacterium sp. TaxID=1871053 RepID=UPI0026079CCD|nr:amino acid racemase [Phenylobacterium sp.]
MTGSLTLGVLGGMGPAATLDFLQKLQAYTPAEQDQDHIRVLVDINPKVPDRNAPGSLAGPLLAEMAGALRGAGAEVLAIACNTAHAYAGMIQRASGLPLVDMIETAARAAARGGAMRAGVLGTRGAVKLYREYLAAQAMGLVTLPSERQEAFMQALYRIKAGDTGPEVRREMAGLAKELVAQGAEVVIAGCTEVPLVMGADDLRVEFVEPSELLAKRCVAVCLGMEAVPALPV